MWNVNININIINLLLTFDIITIYYNNKIYTKKDL